MDEVWLGHAPRGFTLHGSLVVDYSLAKAVGPLANLIPSPVTVFKFFLFSYILTVFLINTVLECMKTNVVVQVRHI